MDTVELEVAVVDEDQGGGEDETQEDRGPAGGAPGGYDGPGGPARGRGEERGERSGRWVLWGRKSGMRARGLRCIPLPAPATTERTRGVGSVP